MEKHRQSATVIRGEGLRGASASSLPRLGADTHNPREDRMDNQHRHEGLRAALVPPSEGAAE